MSEGHLPEESDLLFDKAMLEVGLICVGGPVGEAVVAAAELASWGAEKYAQSVEKEARRQYKQINREAMQAAWTRWEKEDRKLQEMFDVSLNRHRWKARVMRRAATICVYGRTVPIFNVKVDNTVALEFMFGVNRQ